MRSKVVHRDKGRAEMVEYLENHQSGDISGPTHFKSNIVVSMLLL
jgi:hypothetical protein